MQSVGKSNSVCTCVDSLLQMLIGAISTTGDDRHFDDIRDGSDQLVVESLRVPWSSCHETRRHQARRLDRPLDRVQSVLSRPQSV